MRISNAEAAFLHIIDTSRLLRILKGDASAIIHAASKAEQAFNYLKAFRPPEEPCDAENHRATEIEEPA